MNAEQSKIIEQLYLEMFDMLMAYARSSLTREALAEEAVQETFKIACQKPEDILTSPNPRGWLVKVLKHVILNMKHVYANATLMLTDYLADTKCVETGSEDIIGLDAMYAGISETEEFQIIKEMAVEGKSHLEMARERGITVNACKKRVQRAKEFLRKKLSI